MPNEITSYARKILGAVSDLEKQQETISKEANKVKKEILDERIKALNKIIGKYIKEIYTTIEQVSPKPILEKKEEQVVKTFTSSTFRNLSKQEKEKFREELGIDFKQLEKFIKEQKTKKTEFVQLKKEDYSLYKPNKWGEFANRYTKKYADSLVKSYPKFFEPLVKSFETVNLPFLTRTYISVMIFFSILSLPTCLILFSILNLSFKFGWGIIVLATILAPFITFTSFYFYPTSLQGGRERKIRQELPFALIHMSAVAGSGAHPISIFELLVDSKEYPELKKEYRKVLNYVNLFGYDLTTAMNNVASSTPSRELKELFNGMVSTIQTGGDLKAYIKEKANEALNTYKLERKKKVDALATLSEVYTAVLIAAPLLLLVALAIMNNVGGDLAGVSLSTIAYASIGIVLPILNIGFMFFVGASQK